MSARPPLRVLLVDDDDADRYLARRALESGPAEIAIDEADGFETAAERLAATGYDVIVTDYMLRGSTGLEIIRLTQERDLDIPIVLLTGTGTEEVAIQAMRLGVADYVIKSLEHVRRLPATVEHVLEKAAVQRSRMRAEQALRKSEAELRAVVSNAPVILFILDGDGRFILASGRGLEGLGLVPEQLTGRSVFEIYPSSTNFLYAVRRALSGETVNETVRIAERTFEVALSALHPAATEPGRVIGVATDVTEKRALEEQLRQAQKMEAMGQLASGVAHDFNNLLTVIGGQSRLSRLQLPPDHPVLRSLDAIDAAAAQASSITGALLTYSRKAQSEKLLLDLRRVVEEASRLFRPMLPETIRFELDLPAEGTLQLWGDPVQLQQIILNLAFNARDAMPEGGTLRIAAATIDTAGNRSFALEGPPDRNLALIEVSDTGIGMDPHVQAQAFEPFFTTKKKGKGTGLGLAVAQGIVAEHGGQIRVRSEVGKGSTFTLSFPILSTPSKTNAASPSSTTRFGTANVPRRSVASRH